MKEPRFIELLNLYVDQQLTAAEAAELESELQHNPSRRRTYQQYCRMQKACTQLFEQECQGAPTHFALSRALAQADQKVSAFPEQRTAWRQRGFYAAGLAAMAACVAFVLVRQTPGTDGASPVSSNSVPAATVAVAEPVAPAIQTVKIPPVDPQTKALGRSYYSVFPVRQFVPVQVVSGNGEAIAQNGEQPDFAWMKNVELAPMRPVSVDALVAESNNAIAQPARLYIDKLHSTQQGFYEKAAFQFQKDK